MPSVLARPRPASRVLPTLLVSGALALGVTACGGDSDESASTSTSAAAGASTAAFPVTIKHAQGSTTIKSEPKRVVALGWSDQDPLLALGVKPVGYTEWFNEEPGGVFPWAEKAAAGGPAAEKVATADQIDYEKLAAARPDLILALYDEIDGPTYAKLSKIAPVVANDPKYDGFGTTWQDLTITTGKAVGREPQARKLVADLETRFTKLRADHPEWSKETLVMMADLVNGNFSVFSPQDAKTRFFAGLGFKTTPKFLDGKFKTGENTTIISAEDASLLDVDRLAWTSDPALVGKLKKNRLYNTLNVVKDGRVSYLDYTKAPFTGAAVTFNTVLSIPYALDRVIPQLTAAKQPSR